MSEQHLETFHDLFDGEPKRFYREIVSLKCASYKGAKQVMETTYKNINRHTRVQQYFQGLNISEIMEKESYDVGCALEKLRNVIIKYGPMDLYSTIPKKQ